MVRHFRLAGAVAELAGRMQSAASSGPLMPRVTRPPRRPPPLPRALGSAVGVAAVANAADHHQRMASAAVELPGAGFGWAGRDGLAFAITPKIWIPTSARVAIPTRDGPPVGGWFLEGQDCNPGLLLWLGDGVLVTTSRRPRSPSFWRLRLGHGIPTVSRLAVKFLRFSTVVDTGLPAAP